MWISSSSVGLSKDSGFALRRVQGSHHVYRHEKVPRLLNLQSRNGEAKPYQIGQFLEMVREFDLTPERER